MNGDTAAPPAPAEPTSAAREARRVAQYALAAGALLSFAVLAWDAATGGFHVRVLGIRISSWELDKPFRDGIVCAVLAFWIHDRDARPSRTAWALAASAAPWIAAAAATAAIVVAIRFGTFAAGGSDAYGYVSQGGLLASGHLTARDPLASLEPTAGPAVAPLGYRVRSDGVLTPVYAPGLPLAMAAAIRIGGPSAVYFIVPLFAALAVWLTYLLGARIGGPVAGGLAGVLVAACPIFVFQSLQPMSDVPATAWWLLSWWLAVADGSGTAFGAGLAASAAILTRPNMVPLAAIVAVQTLTRRPRTRVGWFVAGVVPACVAIGALNAYMYGSPLRPGYGSLETLFAWGHVAQNLRNYTSWFVELLTPAVLIAIAAPLAVRAKTTAGLMLAFAAATLALYVGYLVYDNWTFLRFLLPAVPLLFILASAVAVWCVGRAPVAVRGASLFLLITLAPCRYLIKAGQLHVFATARAEHRHVAVGRFLRDNVPPNALVLALTENGSVRFYGERPTILWEALDPDRLDTVLADARAHGYSPYLLLEDWEVDSFRRRFGKTSAVGAVDWPPAIRYFGPIDVAVYAIDDRERFRRGARILPRVVPSD